MILSRQLGAAAVLVTALSTVAACDSAASGGSGGGSCDTAGKKLNLAIAGPGRCAHPRRAPTRGDRQRHCSPDRGC